MQGEFEGCKVEIQLKDKWAIITGATAGIGEATSYALAKEGCHLILCGRRVERLNNLAEKLRSQFQVQVEPLAFDLRENKQMSRVIHENTLLFEKVSILVNNAGLAKGVSSFAEAKEEDILEMINTNITALFLWTRKLLPFLRKQKFIDIINLGSVAGRWTYPGGSVYCATKHAVLAFSEGLRKDLNGENVRVTCIEPGMVNTEFSLVRLGDKEKADQVYQGMQPLLAEDIADAIVWSLKRPEHVNIQELVIYPRDQAHVTQVHRKNEI